MASKPLQNAEMMEILHLNGDLLNLPPPSDRQWGASITKWLKRGLDIAFIEHVATNNEGQEWSSNRKAKAKLLAWEFGKEAEWRLKMENILRSMEGGIAFGLSGSNEWEAVVIQCYQLGFNVGFVEDIERRQKPRQTWTPTMRDRAKILEWEFHRPELTTKYTEEPAKSTATVVKEMLEEKGIKLS
jgi:hypothetical protein